MRHFFAMSSIAQKIADVGASVDTFKTPSAQQSSSANPKITEAEGKSSHKKKKKKSKIENELDSVDESSPNLNLSGIALTLAGLEGSISSGSSSSRDNEKKPTEKKEKLRTSAGLEVSIGKSSSKKTEKKLTEKREKLRTLAGLEGSISSRETEKPKEKKERLRMKTSMTNERPFVCKQCKKGFWTKANLQAHTKVHSKERSYQCTRCPKEFKGQTTLDNHMKRFHHKTEEPSDKANRLNESKRLTQDKRAKPSNFAEKSTNESRATPPPSQSDKPKPVVVLPKMKILQIKLERCDDPREPVLGYLFSFHSNFTRKSKAAKKRQAKNNENNWTYPFIFPEEILNYFDFEHFILSNRTGDDYEAKQEEEDNGAVGNEEDYLILKGFLALEPEDQSKKLAKFDCVPCGKRFRHSPGITNHMRIHHRWNRLWSKCNECNREFRSHHLLIAHMNQYLDDRPFKCQICPKSFFDNKALFCHVRLGHNIRRKKKAKKTAWVPKKKDALRKPSKSRSKSSSASTVSKKAAATSSSETNNVDDNEKTPIQNSAFPEKTSQALVSENVTVPNALEVNADKELAPAQIQGPLENKIPARVPEDVTVTVTSSLEVEVYNGTTPTQFQDLLESLSLVPVSENVPDSGTRAAQIHDVPENTGQLPVSEYVTVTSSMEVVADVDTDIESVPIQIQEKSPAMVSQNLITVTSSLEMNDDDRTTPIPIQNNFENSESPAVITVSSSLEVNENNGSTTVQMIQDHLENESSVPVSENVTDSSFLETSAVTDNDEPASTQVQDDLEDTSSVDKSDLAVESPTPKPNGNQVRRFNFFDQAKSFVSNYFK